MTVYVVVSILTGGRLGECLSEPAAIELAAILQMYYGPLKVEKRA